MKATDFDTQDNFVFAPKKDIWDIHDLIKKIQTLELKQVNAINEYLEEEFFDKLMAAKETRASEVDTIIDLIEYISGHKEVKRIRETFVDPDFKVYKRFKEFTKRLVAGYTSLVTVYGEALGMVSETLGIDEAQDIIIMIFLQDISIRYLEEADDNPVMALNNLVTYFEDNMSSNGKQYDRAAIKFYLINEMIKCNVFPNEGSDEIDYNE